MLSSQVVCFTYSTGPGHRGLVGRLAALADLAPGWSGPRHARQHGARDLPEIVHLVFER